MVGVGPGTWSDVPVVFPVVPVSVPVVAPPSVVPEVEVPSVLVPVVVDDTAVTLTLWLVLPPAPVHESV